MNGQTLSIVMPAYNEAQRISPTLDSVLEYVAQQNWDAEIIVVNDGSTDETGDIVRGYARQYPSVRLLQNPENRGKGYSVRVGMLDGRGDILLFSDAALSTPVTEAAKQIEAIENGAVIAIGSRWLRRELQKKPQPLHRQICGRIFNLVIRMVLGLSYNDTQCGFKAFTRRAAQVLFPAQRIERFGFDSELLLLARKCDFTIQEVPVAVLHDDRSKIDPIRDGLRMLLETLQIRWYDLSNDYETVLPVAVPIQMLAAHSAMPLKTDEAEAA